MARRWSRADAVVALAAYMDRPAGFRLPPDHEVQRLANLLDASAAEVRRRLRAFAALDRGDASGEVRAVDRDVWRDFAGRPSALFGDADHIVAKRRARPHPVWRRLGRASGHGGP